MLLIKVIIVLSLMYF